MEAKLADANQAPSAGLVRPPVSTAPPPASSHFVKSKFYGESHWYNAIEPYEALGVSYAEVHQNSNRTEINRSSELYVSVLDCKRMARIIKEARSTKPSIELDIQSSLPSKGVCDQLLDCYFRTFEGVFRVLHIPTFQKEYETHWDNSKTTSPSILMKIILVCAIGVSFYTGEGKARLRSSCAKWIHAADAWLNTAKEKSKLSLTGIQIHILLLTAKQVCAVDGDLIWIPAGALLRSAMHIGLHRDPSHFPKISTFHAEMRRRLWSTVLEMTIQLSLDMGMPPMLSPQDFDTLPPSKLNDEDIGEGVGTSVEPRPANEFTDTSIQIAFSGTVHLRLEITRLINSLRSNLDYDDTLRLGSELVSSCRTEGHSLYTFLGTPRGPTPFQVKIFDVLVRRFVLCLHRPFFARAKSDPKYYYSRKACLDTSLSILTPAPGSSSEDEDDWTRFSYYSVGVFKSFWLYSMSTVYLELIAQIEEQRQEVAPFQPIPLHPTRPLDFITTINNPSVASDTSSRSIHPRLILPPQTESLRNVIIAAQRTSEGRVRNGEANIKGNVFVISAIARIDALIKGTDANAAVLEAAKKSIAISTELMRQAYREENGVDIDLSGRSAVLAGVEGSLDASHGMNAFGEGTTDMDWDALIQDESMDFGFGFESSPENWFTGEWGSGDGFTF
ncbi:fungal-specific transcription factor domain-containing protein [Lophiotrema nucula]|uniref:Fungal-specific transcription factor domain-containing protein n=1 Tax=Lophiotrema nucula TaxID=690887 RepID=A0A6A5Z4J2_9PLEO|nr:fungal-specific transcription factor domain-containing protein [Lophiotrema nucula]